MPYLITPAAKSDIDQIWSYIFLQSGSQEIADRLTDTVYSRILLLSRYPYLGRDRSADLGIESRSLSVGEYVIVYRLTSTNDVRVLRVVHGRRDLESLFGR
jgi:plasmid stabilization system protein ParE